MEMARVSGLARVSGQYIIMIIYCSVAIGHHYTHVYRCWAKQIPIAECKTIVCPSNWMEILQVLTKTSMRLTVRLTYFHCWYTGNIHWSYLDLWRWHIYHFVSYRIHPLWLYVTVSCKYLNFRISYIVIQMYLNAWNFMIGGFFSVISHWYAQLICCVNTIYIITV